MDPPLRRRRAGPSVGPPRVQVIRTPLEFLYDIRQRVVTLGDDGGGLIVLAKE